MTNLEDYIQTEKNFEFFGKFSLENISGYFLMEKDKKRKVREYIEYHHGNKKLNEYKLIQPMALQIMQSKEGDHNYFVEWEPLDHDGKSMASMIYGTGQTLEEAINDFLEYLISVYHEYTTPKRPNELSQGAKMFGNYLKKLIDYKKID
jgi:hypothetical protein